MYDFGFTIVNVGVGFEEVRLQSLARMFSGKASEIPKKRSVLVYMSIFGDELNAPGGHYSRALMNHFPEFILKLLDTRVGGGADKNIGNLREFLFDGGQFFFAYQIALGDS